MQCDPAWGTDQMGVPGMGAEDDTICNQGCAMSCVAMALAGFNFTINGTVSFFALGVVEDAVAQMCLFPFQYNFPFTPPNFFLKLSTIERRLRANLH